METSTIGVDEMTAMMHGAVAQVRSGCAWLTELDSVCGDGDHGITMSRAMDRVDEALQKSGERDIKGLISRIGWALLGVDGGATGPLLGTFFLGISGATREKEELDPPRLAAVFEAGVEAVQKHTQARRGDKTMMDALIPAVAAMRAAAEREPDVLVVLQQAAQAAQQGAASTKAWIARFGKARLSESRTLGHQDPGATSMAMIFQGFHEGLLGIRNR